MVRVFSILLFLVTGFTVAALTGNPLAGQQKSQICVACHSLDGNSITTLWPKIAGLSEKYLLEQLLEYKKGEEGARFEPTMYGIVEPLSEQDLADLAAYYSTQVMTIGEAQPDLVELGQSIYRGGNLATGVPACSACHGPEGDGNYLALFPRLSGQNSEYVVDQLNKFKNDKRQSDPNGMMRDIASRMSDKEMEAVASYVQGLH